MCDAFLLLLLLLFPRRSFDATRLSPFDPGAGCFLIKRWKVLTFEESTGK